MCRYRWSPDRATVGRPWHNGGGGPWHNGVVGAAFPGVAAGLPSVGAGLPSVGAGLPGVRAGLPTVPQRADPFAGKCMVISVFAKALYQVAGLRPVDPNFDQRRDKQQYELRVKRLDVTFSEKLRQIHEAALNKNLWRGTAAARDPVEYWAAGVEAYFDAAGEGQAPNLADRPIVTREALKAYDPELYALVDETMAYRGHVDWRFQPR